MDAALTFFFLLWFGCFRLSGCFVVFGESVELIVTSNTEDSDFNLQENTKPPQIQLFSLDSPSCSSSSSSSPLSSPSSPSPSPSPSSPSSPSPSSSSPSSPLSLLCVLDFLSSPPGGVLWWINETSVEPSVSWTSWTGRGAGLFSASCLWEAAPRSHGASYWCGVQQHGVIHKHRLCSE